MTLRTLYNHAFVVEALAPATYTTGANAGTAVDLGLYGNRFRDVLFAIVAGASGDSGTHTFTLTECATTDGEYAAIPAARCQGLPLIIDSDNDNAIHLLGCRPTLGFVKLVDTAASADTGAVLSAVAILGSGSSAPPRRA